MFSEFNEGEPYDDYGIPGQDPLGKETARHLFGRMENKKMVPIIGIDKNKIRGNSYVFQEFPHAMFHRKFGDKIVNNKEEETQALKEGWQLTPVKIKREEYILERIPQLEEELSGLIAEFEDLTGLDYENELEKKRRKES
mgnify:CR=1 FL=1